MKIKCKFLDKTELEIELNEEDSIEQVKSKIQAAKDGDAKYAPAISKLIWKGKILTNTQTCKECSVDSKGFFVVMPGKPAASSSTSKPAAATGTSTSSQPTNAATPAPTTPAATTPAPTTPAPTNTAPPAVAPSTPQAHPAVQMSKEDVLNLLATRVQVDDGMISQIVAISNTTATNAKTAILVAQGNADVAVELILSGDLDKAVTELTREFSSRASGLTSTEGETGGSSAAVETGSSVASDNPLAYLMEDADFRKVLTEIRNNPAILPNFLQQIAGQNAQLFEQLSNNHEHFLALLQSDDSAFAAATPQQPAAAIPQRGQAAGANPTGGQAAPRQLEIQITADDRAKIDQIIGITNRSEMEVVQAFFACEKNVQNTINILFENMD